MNQDLFLNICQIYKTEKLSINSINNISASDNENNNNYVLKEYLLDFLIDKTSEKEVIDSYEDFWFIKGNSKNIELINKYIKLMLDYIICSNKNYINFISSFLDSKIKKKVLLLLLIIDKCNLPNSLILLFIGFILGEDEEFIRKNYQSNMKSILGFLDINIYQIDKDMPINEINEKFYEIVNLLSFSISKYQEERNDENFEEEDEVEENDEEKEKREEEIDEEYNNKNYSLKKINNKNDKDLLYLSLSFVDKEYFNKINLNYYKKYIDSNEYDEIFTYNEYDKIKEENKNILKSFIDILKIEIRNNINENEENNIILFKDNKIKQKEFPLIFESKSKIGEENVKNCRIKDSNNILEKGEEEENINENILKEIKFDNNDSINSDNGNNSNENTTYNTNKSPVNYNKLYKINNYLVTELKNLNINDYYKPEEKIGINLDTINYMISQQVIMQDLTFVLNKKKENIMNELYNSAFTIDNFIEKINLGSDVEKLQIINLRLEIIIKFLKNPNIILLKRKILEIILFELYKLKKDEFQLPKDYKPSRNNLEELEKLMETKKNNNPNNKKIKFDIDKLKSIKIKIINEENNTKIHNEEKREESEQIELKENNNKIMNKSLNQYHINKSLIDFYKQKLHQVIHINKDKSEYYFVPEFFNSKVEEAHFLSQIKIISKKNDRNNKDEKSNFINIEEEMNLKNELFIKDKIIDIDYAFDIIFSDYSEINYLDNNFIKNLNLKSSKYKRNNYNLNFWFQNLCDYGFEQKEAEKYIDDINNIKNISHCFISEVIAPINDFFNNCINKTKQKEDFNLIKKIKYFIKNYSESCSYSFIQCNELYKKYGRSVITYLKVKIYILEKIQEMIHKQKEKLMQILEKNRKDFIKDSKKLINNLKKLKKIIDSIYNEDEYKYYKEWINLTKKKYSIYVYNRFKKNLILII